MVNYTEVLVGPSSLGPEGSTRAKAALRMLGIETVPVDARLAERVAEVRASTKLKLPDAYAVATALDFRADADVRLESFDKRVTKVFAELRATGF